MSTKRQRRRLQNAQDTDKIERNSYETSYFAGDTLGNGVGLPSVLAALMRHAKLIVLFAILGAALGYFFAERRGPIYVADAVVVLEPDNNTLNLLEISEGLKTNRSTVETQLDVFKSTELLADVIQRVTDKHTKTLNTPDGPSQTIPNIPKDEQINWLSNAISVGRKGESLALKIVVRAPDAVLAADLANEIGQTFLDRRVDQKRSEISVAEDILKQRTTEVRKQLSDSEKELAILVQAEQLDDVDQDIRLRAQAAQLQAQMASLNASANPDEQRLALLATQEEVIQRKLIDRTIATIRKEEITREIENSRQRHEQIFEQLLRVEAENIIMSPGAQLVSAADAPLKPTGISSKTSAALGLLSLSFLAILTSIFTAAFDKRVRTSAQLENILNAPCLGSIPLTKKVGKKLIGKRSILNQMKAGSRTIFSTSVRKAFFNLQTQCPKKTGLVVGVTSCTQNEGKSTVAASFAAAANLKKQRVAVVDFDMWHQGVDGLIELEGEPEIPRKSLFSRKPTTNPRDAMPSVQDWFDENMTMEEIGTSATSFDNVDVFPWIIRSGDSYTELDENRIKDLFKYLRSNYDLTIVDTAPFMLVSETAVVSTELDGFVVVVAWEQTTDQVLHNLKKSMDLAGVRVIGSVLNRVDSSKQKLYGSGEYVQYYKAEDGSSQ